jgi:predicted MFS family arabinose efflux permease
LVFIGDHSTWRWVFYVNLPIGIAALLVLIFLMPTLRSKQVGKALVDMEAVKVGLTSGIHNVYVLSTILMIIGFFLIFFLKEIPLRGSKSGAVRGQARGSTAGEPSTVVMMH